MVNKTKKVLYYINIKTFTGFRKKMNSKINSIS